MNVFLDMDGVLADLMKGYERVAGMSLPLAEIYHNHNRAAIWKPAMEVEEFWFNLEHEDGAEDLLGWMHDNHPHDKTFILTAPVKLFDGCSEQKRKWAKTHTHVDGYNVHVVPRWEKKNYAYDVVKDMPNVLVDDYDKNIREWEEHGGIGIQHININDTLQRLNELLGDKQ